MGQLIELLSGADVPAESSGRSDIQLGPAHGLEMLRHPGPTVKDVDRKLPRTRGCVLHTKRIFQNLVNPGLTFDCWAYSAVDLSWWGILR